MASVAQRSDTLPASAGSMEKMLLSEPWLQSQNAAGLDASFIVPVGKITAGTSLEQGDFRRPQQAAHNNLLSFKSENYQQLNKAKLYGSFQFTEEWNKKLVFTDVMDPYRGNPYILADSIGGDWKKQWYDLQLKASTGKIANEKLSLGAALRYKTGSGARQNDPRPLNTTNEIELSPGLVWHISNKQHLGLNGWYSIYKERVSIDVKNTQIYHNLYELLGLGNYSNSLVSVSATRNYEGKKYGGDLQYDWQLPSFRLFATVGFKWKTEDAVDGTSTPQQAGRLKEKEYDFGGSIQYIHHSLSHYFRFNGVLYDRTGHEYHQRYDTTSLKWTTVYEADLFSSLVSDMSFSYHLVKSRTDGTCNWGITATAAYNGLDSRYVYPEPKSREIVDIADYSLVLEKNWRLSRSSDLQLVGKAGYRDCFTNEMQYTPNTAKSGIIASKILYPDYAYLTTDAWRTGFGLQYGYKVSATKATQAFVRVDADYCKPVHTTLAAGDRTLVKLTFGVFY